MPMLTRRATIAGIGGTVVFATAARTRAQNAADGFPNRPIALVVPYPAGGPVDIVARLLAQEAAPRLGRPIIVDNRGGGSGIIGSLAVARAAPDGHMLVLGTNQTHATNQSLVRNCPYDAVRDFAPVAGIAAIPHVLVVPASLPVATIDAFVAFARTKPGVLNYGSTGIGSGSHLAFELLMTRAGIRLQHIPFRGAAPMMQELLAGRIDASIATLPSVIGQIEVGSLVPLAVASATRAASLPAVPTLAEAGFPGVEADAWFTVFAPAHTPVAIIDRLFGAFAAALASEASQATLAKQGMRVWLRTPSQIAQTLPAEIAAWAAVIKAANVVVE
jgi:tripartite-type tricarboxylate transporter receptor subunit TctC